MRTAPPSDAWVPGSWQSKPVSQQPGYADSEKLEATLSALGRLPPLVTSWEIESLKQQLGEAAEGRGFLLQGGDCSESFDDCESVSLTNKLKILLQMSLVLVHGLRKRVIRVGRFAGQYAKPRSSDVEIREGVALPSYRGDLVNGVAFEPAIREPDPERLLRGYERSALTLNFIRSLVDGDFTDLHHPEYWDLSFFEQSGQAKAYRERVEAISESLRFMETLTGHGAGAINRAEFFTSHEGLLLPYEQAQTRQVPRRSGWFNLSTHFPWIGDRTRQLDGAHVEFFRGIENPIGVKVGPSTTPADLLELVGVLNPRDEPGRLTLIHRFGSDAIERHLPPLLEAVEGSGQKVLWCCDPMHGNTENTEQGLKTRSFDKILAELEQAFELHARVGTYLGGVHFELTGDDVTECTGGARGLAAADLERAYRSQVDPRLNYEQALEMAILLANRTGS